MSLFCTWDVQDDEHDGIDSGISMKVKNVKAIYFERDKGREFPLEPLLAGS